MFDLRRHRVPFWLLCSLGASCAAEGSAPFVVPADASRPDPRVDADKARDGASDTRFDPPVLDAGTLHDTGPSVEASAPVDAGSSDARDASVDSDAAVPVGDGGREAGHDADAAARYSHTITIDGVSDFVADETLPTTTLGHATLVSYDASNLYVGLEGASLSQGSASQWWVIYLGGTTLGTTTPVPYNTQSSTLPFAASHQLQWKTNDTLTKLLTWNGSAWVDLPFDFTGRVHHQGQFVEISLPLSLVASTSVRFLSMLINEEDQHEWTWAGTPSAAFVDGYRPTLAKYLEFRLDAPLAPALYSPLP